MVVKIDPMPEGLDLKRLVADIEASLRAHCGAKKEETPLPEAKEMIALLGDIPKGIDLDAFLTVLKIARSSR